MSTESDIPVNLGTDDRPLFTLPEHNEAVKLIKPTTHKRMISFEKSLRALGKSWGSNYSLATLAADLKASGRSVSSRHDPVFRKGRGSLSTKA